MRESKTNVGRGRNERFRVAKTAPRSFAILAKFYDVCSRDVQSPGENASFRLSSSLYGVATSPMGRPQHRDRDERCRETRGRKKWADCQRNLCESENFETIVDSLAIGRCRLFDSSYNLNLYLQRSKFC